MKFKATLLSYKRDDGTRSVVITITDNYKREYIPLKDIFCRKADWNKKTGRALPGRENADKINTEVLKQLGRIEAEWLKDKNIGLKQLASRMRGNKRGKTTLRDFIQDYIDRCEAGKINNKKGKPISKNTYKGYGNLLYRLELFCKYKAEVDFSDIDSDFYNDYVHFLRHGMAEAKKNESGDLERQYKNLADNSIGTDIKNIKKFMKLAIKAGHTTNDAWEEFAVIDHEVDSITFDEGEIQKIIDKEIPKHLEEERERFLCSYNLLLRYNDSVSDLGKGNLVEQKGKRFFHTRTTKVGARVLVPIMDVVWKILKKNNFKIPQPTLQEANWKLKEICRLADIVNPVTIHETRDGKVTAKTYLKYELASSHTARRSGATNMLLAGLPIRVIMDLGGWDTEESFKRYIRYDKIISAKIASEHKFFK